MKAKILAFALMAFGVAAPVLASVCSSGGAACCPGCPFGP